MTSQDQIVGDELQVVRCAWLVNPGVEPLQNVRITVADESIQEITSVPPDERQLIEPVALLPRFVNAHTHLEFSNLGEPIEPASPFTDWIRSVIRYRMNESVQAVGEAIGAGVKECRAHGVDLVGEITTSDYGLEALSQQMLADELASVSFRECLGFTRDRIDSQLEAAEAHCSAESTVDCVFWLSPHAPYSVHPQLFDALVDLAAERNRPLAMHLAETRDELEFLHCQSGRFVDFLKSMKLWDSSVLSPDTKPLRYLERLAIVPHALAVHGNYFDEREIQYLGQHPNIATVYCPRTHAYFEHSPHPWQKLQAAGATVILGTDSRASNPDLSVWKELQLVAKQTSLPIWNLLPMITTTAASALGFSAVPYNLKVDGPFNVSRVSTTAQSMTRLQNELVVGDLA